MVKASLSLYNLTFTMETANSGQEIMLAYNLGFGFFTLFVVGFASLSYVKKMKKERNW